MSRPRDGSTAEAHSLAEAHLELSLAMDAADASEEMARRLRVRVAELEARIAILEDLCLGAAPYIETPGRDYAQRLAWALRHLSDPRATLDAVAGGDCPGGEDLPTPDDVLGILAGYETEEEAEMAAEARVAELEEALREDREKWGFSTLEFIAGRLLEERYPDPWPDNMGPDDPGPRLVAALRDCLAAQERSGD